MEYNVKLKTFTGPLDLLLHLVRKNELDIFEIPIAQITDEYLQYIELLKELNLELAGEFLVYASTLMYLKSRSLLPAEQKTEEEILDEQQQLQELKEKLAEYEKFKKLALTLEQRQKGEEQLFARELSLFIPEDEETTIDATLFELMDAFAFILKEAEKDKFFEITKDEITVKEKIAFITDTIKKKNKIVFSSLFKNEKSRQGIIVTFMALLELIRLKKIKIKQSSIFGKIWLISNI